MQVKRYGNLFILLSILVFVSTVILSYRMIQISATAYQADLKLNAQNMSGSGAAIQSTSKGTSSGTAASADGSGFAVSDDEQTWTAETKVNIFKSSYSEQDDNVTVMSENGDKVFAPGTENSYKFKVSNTGDTPLDYQVQAKAYYGDHEYTIPITVRLSDYKGNYLAGGAGSWVPVQDLEKVNETAVLGANHYAWYTLDWKWPYEEDDEYDTFIGNLAADEDISLTVVIRITAMQDSNPDATGGIPQTGDQIKLMLWISLAVLAFVTFVVLLVTKKKDRKGLK
jgi:hypothetical protein